MEILSLSGQLLIFTMGIMYLTGIILISYLPKEWELFYLARVFSERQWFHYKVLKGIFILSAILVPILILVTIVLS